MRLLKKSISVILVFCFTIFSFATNVNAASEMLCKDKKTEKMMDKYMQEANKQYPFSGTILVSQKGKIVFRKAYGNANYEKNIPNTPTTKFTIASLTKQFVGVGIMMLQEKNQLNVNDPISKYIPSYPNGNNITIHHLLTNTSGIADYLTDEFALSKESKRPYTVDEIINLFKDKPAWFKPGERFAYSNSNYALLGKIIEKVSGEPCENFLSNNIFKPLNMKNTGFYIDNGKIKNAADGYIRTETGKEKCSNTDMFMNTTGAYVAGGMYSTIDDLCLWDKALKGNKLLKKESLDKIYTEYTKDMHYGYGVMIENSHNKKCIYHSGGMPGVETHLFRYIDDDTCIILLSNLPGAGYSDIEKNLFSILYEGKYEQPKAFKEITLDSKILDRYTGKYELMAGTVFQVTRENDKLYIGEIGGIKDRVYPYLESEFFYKTSNRQVAFENIENEKSMNLILKYGEKRYECKRVD